MRRIKKRGASFFTIDAMIAGLILVAAITTLFSTYINKPEIEDVQTVLINYVEYITTTKMNYFNKINPAIYYDENEKHPDYTINQKVAYLWDSEDETLRNKSKSFVKNFTDTIVPKQFGVKYIYEDTVIYNHTIAPDEQPIINLTINIATFYINDTKDLVGPKTTKVILWSK